MFLKSPWPQAPWGMPSHPLRRCLRGMLLPEEAPMVYITCVHVAWPDMPQAKWQLAVRRDAVAGGCCLPVNLGVLDPEDGN